MRGTGAVAIWHDIAEEGRSAFYDWHGNEHMLERVGIPGFRRGRRYVAIDADLGFFNLYEAEALATLTGPGYQGRLNSPTPWTVATVRHFRRVNRSLCDVVRSDGIGSGGLAATLRCHGDSAPLASSGLWEDLLMPLRREAGVAGVHVLVADAGASGLDTAERRARGGDLNTLPSGAILVEGWGDEDEFGQTCRTHLSSSALSRWEAIGPVALGLYRLQLTVDAAD